MNCLITGASGLVGGELLALLLNEPRIEGVVSLGRRDLPVRHPKLQQRIVDWERVGDLQLPNSDIAFCCLGTTIKKAGSRAAFRHVDHDMVIAFAEAAKKAGARKFLVVSALGANADSRIFYNRVKGEMERDLARVGFDSVVIHRPSLLLGERKEHRTGEALAIKLYPFYSPLFVGPLAKQKPIQARQVAAAMLEKAFASTAREEVVLNHEML